jgi:hypothetical protein
MRIVATEDISEGAQVLVNYGEDFFNGPQGCDVRSSGEERHSPSPFVGVLLLQRTETTRIRPGLVGSIIGVLLLVCWSSGQHKALPNTARRKAAPSRR